MGDTVGPVGVDIDTYIPAPPLPEATAANTDPELLDAIPFQVLTGADVCVQAIPALLLLVLVLIVIVIIC